ncbi:hypothetical protein T03_6532 [Trichinella britovi]|uniref:Uncharacterized protein n=1 Tax=Trichinella britovi TaxID=45882 RepID=A0A0V1C8D2_TRIBR|nr:hypothetical protein T03_6532 [Trichinella britovi]
MKYSSKNSLHDGIKHCIGKKCDKIFVKKSSFFSFSLRVDLEFLFGLQNIVKSKYTLLDCWGGPHPTLENRVSKNSVHDGIKFFSSCGLSFVKFVKQITDLSRARYSAHFDTKLSSISLLAEKFNKIDVINLLIFLYLEVLGLTSQCSQ